MRTTYTHAYEPLLRSEPNSGEDKVDADFTRVLAEAKESFDVLLIDKHEGNGHLSLPVARQGSQSLCLLLCLLLVNLAFTVASLVLDFKLEKSERIYDVNSLPRPDPFLGLSLA
jgi:hypothetical protein